MKRYAATSILIVLFILLVLPLRVSVGSGNLGPGVVSGTSIAIHFTPTSICSPTAADMDNIRNASGLNAQYVRFDIWWDSVEPNQNAFSSCAYDYYTSILTNIQSEGLKSIAILGTNEPDWVYTACYLGLYPSVEQDALRQYAGNVSRNLGRWITFYQLGNELDSPQYFHEERCESQPVQYLTAIAQGIKNGTTTPYQTIVNTYADNLTFTASCNSQGGWYSHLADWLSTAGSYINIIAIDHYPGTYCQGFWATDGFLSSLAGLASSYGKEYAVTETGWSTFDSSEDAQNTYAQQALSQIYSFANSQVNDNPLLFISWYQLTDYNVGTVLNPYDCCFGLQRGQTTDRPAYQTVATYFHELIGYPVSFTESSLPPGTNWCVTFSNQNQCASGSTIVFNSQPGAYSYSVSISSCGPGCQYLPTVSSGSVTMRFAPATQGVTFIKQYQMTITANIVGGGTNYSPPTVTYRSNGQSQTATIGSSQVALYVDSGSNWNVDGLLTGSTSAERWQTNQPTNGLVTSPLSLSFSFYHQFLFTASYTVSGGGTPPAPALTAEQFGTQVETTLSTTPTGYWFDSSSACSAASSTGGSTSSERWATSTPCPNVNGAQSVVFAYYHQYLATLSYSTIGGNAIQAPALVSREFGDNYTTPIGTSPVGFWLDSSASWSLANPLQGSGSSERWEANSATSGIAAGTFVLTTNYYHQFLYLLSYSVLGGGSPLAPSLTATQFGSAYAQTVTTASTGHWLDYGTTCSVTNPSGGSTSAERWDTNTLCPPVDSPQSVVFTYYHQYQSNISYLVSGGGMPAPPSFECLQFGSAFSYTATTSPTSAWLDEGCSYSFTNPSSNSSPAQRWDAKTNASGTITSSSALKPVYYHQYAISISYVITSGGTPTAPSLTASQYGSPYSTSITSVPTSYWLDAGTSYSLSNPLAGLDSIERWQANEGVNGSVGSAQTLTVKYQHQFYVTVDLAPASAGRVSVKSGWYDADSQVSVSATPAEGFSFGSWTSGGSSISVLNASSSSTVLTVGGSGTLTARFSPLTTSTTQNTTGATTSSEHPTSSTSAILASTTSSTSGSAPQQGPGVLLYALGTLAVALVGAAGIIIFRRMRV